MLKGLARVLPDVYPHVVTTVTSDIEAVLQGHGMTVKPAIVLFDCPQVVEPLRAEVDDCEVMVANDLAEAVRLLRSHQLSVALASGAQAPALLRGLASENLQVAVVALAEADKAAELRAAGIMDVGDANNISTLQALLRRGIDFAALLQLELAHRCEARRLLNRELDLLGQPPEGMSDDLSVFQPPPLPVGPMSIYNLEEASEGFETAYIDRVQQLCSSAREAAVHLGVSSATLSRRLRRESSIDGN